MKNKNRALSKTGFSKKTKKCGASKKNNFQVGEEMKIRKNGALPKIGFPSQNKNNHPKMKFAATSIASFLLLAAPLVEATPTRPDKPQRRHVPSSNLRNPDPRTGTTTVNHPRAESRIVGGTNANLGEYPHFGEYG